MGDDSASNLGEQCIKTIPTVNVPKMVRNSEYKDCTVKHKQPEEAPSAPRPTGQPDAPTWELLGPQGIASFWESTEAPLPHPKGQCNFIHPKQLSPFPERLELPYPSGEILSGYEEVVSFSQDRYTTWVKADPNVTLERQWLTFKRPSQIVVRQLHEDQNQPPKNISSIPTCRSALTFRRG